eukprot:10159435-Karenia_brevis.AAC.1
MAPHATIVRPLSTGMAALQLTTRRPRHNCRTSENNGATRRHCPLFFQAEMAALKLTTSRPRFRAACHRTMAHRAATV